MINNFPRQILTEKRIQLPFIRKWLGYEGKYIVGYEGKYIGEKTSYIKYKGIHVVFSYKDGFSEFGARGTAFIYIMVNSDSVLYKNLQSGFVLNVTTHRNAPIKTFELEYDIYVGNNVFEHNNYNVFDQNNLCKDTMEKNQTNTFFNTLDMISRFIKQMSQELDENEVNVITESFIDEYKNVINEQKFICLLK